MRSVDLTQPRLLHRLAEIDSRLTETEERIQNLDEGNDLRARLHVVETDLVACRQTLETTQARIRDMELELQSTVAKRKRVESDMYSGRIGNPKELAAMQDELGQLDRQGQHLENVILGLMEEVEGLLGRNGALSQTVDRVRTDLSDQETAFRRDREALSEAVAAMRREREGVVAVVEDDLLRRYERIRERRGVAVALVRNGICSGCRVAVPEARARQLIEHEDLLLTCEGCGRILVAAV